MRARALPRASGARGRAPRGSPAPSRRACGRRVAARADPPARACVPRRLTRDATGPPRRASRCRGRRPSAARPRRERARGRSRRPARGARAAGSVVAFGRVRTRTHKHSDARRSAGGSSARYEPVARDETYVATSRISCSDSSPPKAGIAPPPFVTCSTTSSNDGASSSRFGPTEPVEPAASKVWQPPPQPADAKTSSPLAASPVPEPSPLLRRRCRRRGRVGVVVPAAPGRDQQQQRSEDEQQREVPTAHDRSVPHRRSPVNLPHRGRNGPSATQPDESRAVGRLGRVGHDQGVPGELVPDGLPIAPVPRPWMMRTSNRPASGGVDERAQGLRASCAVRPRRSSSSASVGAALTVTACSPRASAAASRSGQAVRRDAHPGRRGPRHRVVACHSRIVPDAELGRDDRIAGGGGAAGSGSSASRSGRLACAKRSEAPRRRPRSCPAAAEWRHAAAPARRGADLDAEPFELGARVGQLALREGDRPIALRLGRGADALDLLLELGDPGFCGSARRQQRQLAAALALASAGRPCLGLREELGDAEPPGVTWAAPRPRAAADRDARDPERGTSAARPSATRYSGSSSRVEPRRGVGHPVRRRRPLLQLGVVARRDGQPACPARRASSAARAPRPRPGRCPPPPRRGARATGRRRPRGSPRASGCGPRRSRGSSRSTARHRCPRGWSRRRERCSRRRA